MLEGQLQDIGGLVQYDLGRARRASLRCWVFYNHSGSVAVNDTCGDWDIWLNSLSHALRHKQITRTVKA